MEVIYKMLKRRLFLNFNLMEFIKNTLLILTIYGFLLAIKWSFEDLTNARNINVYMILPFILFLTPYLLIGLFESRKVEQKMISVPRFLRDIVDNVDSGMDLISSIKTTRNNEYGILNEDINKLINQLSWGITFDKAILNFARNVGSKDLERDLLLTIEARQVGGHVEKILRELSYKIQTENLRKIERKSSLASNTFTGYISFIIFIFVIVVIYNNLFIGMVQNQGSTTAQAQEDTNLKSLTFLSLITILSYELAILSGFLFGLMQENNIIAGAPHVVLLVISVFLTFLFFIK
jgi:flagellar protein FlaJ